MMDAKEHDTLPLLTWVDVARRLATVPMRGVLPSDVGCAPEGVVATDVFWTSLEITIKAESDKISAETWLQSVFGSWLNQDHFGDKFLKFESGAPIEKLPIKYEIVGDDWNIPVFRAKASLEGSRSYSVRFPARTKNLPPVVAFHSVKGGVGRTTSAMAFSQYMASGLPLSKPILLIDADFEAPGISYLYRTRKPEAAISLEDLLALAHTDQSIDFEKTISFIAARITDQRIGDVYILPVKRTLDDLMAFAIRPEHLARSRVDQPYLIVDLVRMLVEKLDCQMAVVDLRAGLVDIALQFLTDPSVDRVFVTTSSGQSIYALNSMFNTLGNIERQTGVRGRQPFVLFNQIPRSTSEPDFKSQLTKKVETQADAKFLNSASRGPNEGVGAVSVAESSLEFGFQHHAVDLISSSVDWDSYSNQLEKSGFVAGLKSEMEKWVESRGINPLFDKPQSSDIDGDRRSSACDELAKYVESREFAESSEQIREPLATPPLQRLISDFRHQPPITIIEGAKGTGKTLTFRYLLEQQNWRNAVQKLDGSLATSFEGVFLPVLGSASSSDTIQSLISQGRESCANILGGGLPQKFSVSTEKIKVGIRDKWNTQEWTTFWLEIIAASAGFAGMQDNWQSFLDAVRAAEESRPVILFEGLEELFVNPYTDIVQADALRSLIRDVPLRLREEAGRPVGLVVFIRGDMLEAVIEQNLQQFRSSYRNYALTWRDIDIQELVVWLVSSSGALPDLWSPNWRSKRDADRETDLRKIWGHKLGKDTTNEARSTEWVLAVLTDLTGRLTARDLIRFIREAALKSRDRIADSRLLLPSAMRQAVENTSKLKVEEYPKEVLELEPIFKKFQQTSGGTTPFDRAEAAQYGITPVDLEVLEKYGVVYADEGRFEVPELFRIGLNLKRKGARPNIISLTRKARERAKA